MNSVLYLCDKICCTFVCMSATGWLWFCCIMKLKADHDFKACTYYQPLHTHTHTRLTALFLGLPGYSSTRKVKPIWILLKQETVSGSSISWAICKSASRDRYSCQQPTAQFFTGQMPFLPPNQQRQSTEGTTTFSSCFSALLWHYRTRNVFS